MKRTTWRTLRSHPFLLAGLLTYAMFHTVEALLTEAHDSAVVRAAMPVMRVVIIPMWLGWLLVTFISVQLFGTHSSPGALRIIRLLQLMAGFAPYLLADALLRWRRAAATTLAA
ncbi:MAG TPA: hypothetical protein VGA18_07505 [Rhodothermales bacterium]